jgi:RNA polymerase sigma-70 factor (ECF subfamily)
MITSVLDSPRISLVSDEALMKDISRQHNAALTELYGRHRQRLKAVIDRVVHEEAEADDVLQETLLQIWNHADHYSAKAGKPLGWLVTIAHRRAIDYLRRHKAYLRARERYSKQLEQQPRNPRREAFDPFVRSDLRDFLKKWMRTLPRFQREAVELAFFKGLSQREIATATHTPLSTVKTRLELGLQKLTHAIGRLRNKI